MTIGVPIVQKLIRIRLGIAQVVLPSQFGAGMPNEAEHAG